MKGKNWLLILIPAVFLTIVPFLILAIYNHPSADDFCYTHLANSQGFWPTQIAQFFDWSGRFTATALLTIAPIDYQDLTVYRILPALLFLLFGASVFLVVNNLLPFISIRDKSLLAFAVFFLYIINAPQITEAFYWMAGAVTYQLASILSLLLFSLILHLQREKDRRKKVFFTCLGGLLCVAITGLNEISMIILCTILFLWLVIDFYVKRSLNMNLAILLVIAVIASGIVVTAPGNFVRMSAKPRRFMFRYSTYRSVKETINFLMMWLPMTILIGLFLVPLFRRIAVQVRKHYVVPSFSVWQMLLLIVLFFGYLCFCFFPAFWSQGGPPPWRTVNVIYLLYIFGFVGFSIMFFLYLQERRMVVSVFPPIVRTILGLLIVVVVVLTPNNISIAYQDLLSGTAYKYDIEMKQRYTDLNNCASNTCRVSPLEHKPQTIFTYDLASDPSEKIYYYNQCMSDYFENPKTLAGRKAD